MNENIGQFMFLSVVVTAGLSFVGVIIWTAQRLKEREAFYQMETIKKVAESGTSGAALEYLRETERMAARRTRDGLRLAGCILPAAGVGLIVFLWMLVPEAPVYLVGVIPVLIGASLLFYAQFIAPRE